jgi:phosphoribosylanthranilate isomerase
MKIKVCGMRDPENLQELLDLPIDYVGLIFYKKSKRFVEKGLPKLDFEDKEKVGVFVNESQDFIIEKSQQYDFVTIQLHGSETPGFCQQLKENNFKIIKAFSVDNEFDFSKTKEYEQFCDYFLFDTKGKLPGGNGYTFDWKILKNYQGETPFFLSGGINSTHNKILKDLKINQLHAIDLNSGFEIEPALKDISLLKKFIEDVRN